MNRLTSREQFQMAYREGRRASNPLITVHARRNGLAQFRVGITVPGRIGGAVVRNHVKRRVREAFRSLRVVPVGVDVVVVPKDAARYAPFPALVGSLQELLGRVAEETP